MKYDKKVCVVNSAHTGFDSKYIQDILCRGQYIIGILYNGKCIWSQNNYFLQKQEHYATIGYQYDGKFRRAVISDHNGLEKYVLDEYSVYPEVHSHSFPWISQLPGGIYDVVEMYDCTGIIEHFDDRGFNISFTDVYFPAVTIADYNTFVDCRFKSINNKMFPNIMHVNDGSFSQNYGQTPVYTTDIYLDNLNFVGEAAFAQTQPEGEEQWNFEYGYLSSVNIQGNAVELWPRAFSGFGAYYGNDNENARPQSLYVNIPCLSSYHSLFGHEQNDCFEGVNAAFDNNTNLSVKMNISESDVQPDVNLIPFDFLNSTRYHDDGKLYCNFILYVPEEKKLQWENAIRHYPQIYGDLINVRTPRDEYDEIMYVTAVCDEDTMPYVRGAGNAISGEYAYRGSFIKGMTIQLDAFDPIDNDYLVFDHWSTGQTDPHIEFTANEDVVISAFFRGYTQIMEGDKNYAYDCRQFVEDTTDIFGKNQLSDVTGIIIHPHTKTEFTDRCNASKFENLSALEIYSKDVEQLTCQQIFRNKTFYRFHIPYVKTIAHAFAECKFNCPVSLDSCETIGSHAFEQAQFNGQLINCAACKTVGDYGFCESDLGDDAIDSFIALTKVGNYGFYSCSMTRANLPNIIDVGEYAFANCSQLKSLALPNAATIGSFAFSGCPLETLDLSRFEKAEVSANFAGWGIAQGCRVQCSDGNITVE